MDRWARSVGEIGLRGDIPDRAALRVAVAALGDGRGVAMFPEGIVGAGRVERVRPGVGYVLARSGATVLPVALFGTRGRHPMDPPRPRTRVDVVYGDPVRLGTEGADPLRRADVLRLSERVRQLLADHVAVAAERTGRAVPPPVPEDGRASA
jgi:1-acyl-sn-glycerol-3-phosphate acyltransferase